MPREVISPLWKGKSPCSQAKGSKRGKWVSQGVGTSLVPKLQYRIGQQINLEIVAMCESRKELKVHIEFHFADGQTETWREAETFQGYVKLHPSSILSGGGEGTSRRHQEKYQLHSFLHAWRSGSCCHDDLTSRV